MRAVRLGQWDVTNIFKIYFVLIAIGCNFFVSAQWSMPLYKLLVINALIYFRNGTIAITKAMLEKLREVKLLQALVMV